MTRDLIRYVVEETKIRDLEISFDSTRCGISQGCSLKTSLSSIRRLSLRACNLIDLDPVLSLLLHPRLEELDLSDNPIELIRFVKRVLVLRDVRTILSSTARSNSHPTLKKKNIRYDSVSYDYNPFHVTHRHTVIISTYFSNHARRNWI